MLTPETAFALFAMFLIAASMAVSVLAIYVNERVLK